MSTTAPQGYPRRNNWLSRMVGTVYLRLTGWRVTGALPELPKYVACVAPHTSNWDLVICIASMFTMNIQLSFMAKHTIFKGVWGPFFRMLGGIAVDRRAAHGVVGECVKAFSEREELVLALAPEGTRSGDGTFKSGFLVIARQAGVPVFLVVLNYEKKEIQLQEHFYVGDQDIETLRKGLQDRYAPIRASNLKALEK
jgi:1-acyl-sn-glycerol-3-phosphate acyltransferase